MTLIEVVLASFAALGITLWLVARISRAIVGVSGRAQMVVVDEVGVSCAKTLVFELEDRTARPKALAAIRRIADDEVRLVAMPRNGDPTLLTVECKTPAAAARAEQALQRIARATIAR